MADILAASNGNWSSSTTWTGGAVPGVNDRAVMNGKSIVLDTDVTVQAISSESIAGSIPGGIVTQSSGIRVVTADLYGYRMLLAISAGSCTINGRIFGVSNNYGGAAVINSGTLVVNGDVIAREGAYDGGLASYGDTTINGTVSAGYQNTCKGVTVLSGICRIQKAQRNTGTYATYSVLVQGGQCIIDEIVADGWLPGVVGECSPVDVTGGVLQAKKLTFGPNGESCVQGRCVILRDAAVPIPITIPDSTGTTFAPDIISGGATTSIAQQVTGMIAQVMRQQ